MKIQAQFLKKGMINSDGFELTEIVKVTDHSIWIKWGSATPKMYRKATMIEIPTIEQVECTSLYCNVQVSIKDCYTCSHLLIIGHCTIGKRNYTWEFTPFFGPTFLTQKGEPRKKYPNPKHILWEIFNLWLDNLTRAPP